MLNFEYVHIRLQEKKILVVGIIYWEWLYDYTEMASINCLSDEDITYNSVYWTYLKQTLWEQNTIHD